MFARGWKEKGDTEKREKREGGRLRAEHSPRPGKPGPNACVLFSFQHPEKDSGDKLNMFPSVGDRG